MKFLKRLLGVCLALSAGSISANNLLMNGGFEIESAPGLPDAWSDGGWGIRFQWAENPEEWRRCFRTDAKMVLEGKQSLRIERKKGNPPLGAYSCYVAVPKFLKDVRFWNFSVYANAPAGGKVQLAVLDAGHNVLASESYAVKPGEWTRLSLQTKQTKETVILRIEPESDGVYYFDAAQFGKNEAAAYTPGLYDSLRLKPVVRGRVEDFFPDARLPLPKPSEVLPLQLKGRVFYREGRPFIPYVFGVQGSGSRDVFKKIAENGFNAVVFYHTGQKSDWIFDALGATGLYAVPWMKPPKDVEFSKLIQPHVNAPSILAWLVIDEPFDPFAKVVLDRVAVTEKTDPAHPVYVNYRTNEINVYMKRMAELPGRVISCDQYPLGNFWWPGTVLDCADLIRKMEEKLAPAGKPLWNWFQITGNAFMNTREPTPAEYEAMLYSSLINGCRGFLTFQNIPFSGDLWKTAGRIGKEFQSLAPVVYGTEIAAPGCSQPGIMMLARRFNGENYLICVNSTDSAVSAAFKIPAGAEAVFENRKLEGSSDTFEPYRRHVYRWRD